MLLRRYHDAKKEEPVTPKVDYSDMKTSELRGLLDQKGIEYDAKTKKDELIRLLEAGEQ